MAQLQPHELVSQRELRNSYAVTRSRRLASSCNGSNVRVLSSVLQSRQAESHPGRAPKGPMAAPDEAEIRMAAPSKICSLPP